jgi:hypothetical protein
VSDTLAKVAIAGPVSGSALHASWAVRVQLVNVPLKVASVDQVLAFARRLPDAEPPPAPDQTALDHILGAIAGP